MIRSRSRGLLAAAVLVPLIALAAAGCGSNNDDSSSPAPANAASRSSATVSVANSGLGKILVDSQGRSLYLFQKDMGTTSECSGACAAAWPPLRATGKPVVGTALSASKIGTTARSDGKPQVTYNGHPLYLYSADQKPGDTNGQGLNVFGGGWCAVSAAGNIVSGKGSGSGSGY